NRVRTGRHVQPSRDDVANQPEARSMKIRPAATRIQAAASAREDGHDRTHGHGHVDDLRGAAVDDIVDLGAANHDPWDGVEHVAQAIIRERDRAPDAAVGGENDELDGHRGNGRRARRGRATTRWSYSVPRTS